MKNIICVILLLGICTLKSQNFNRTSLKFTKEDSSIQVSGGDTSHIYHVLVVTHTLGGITSFSLTNEIYNTQDSIWVMQKDTSYTWSNISAPVNGSIAYKACKPNENVIKVCLGRLYRNRQRLKLEIQGTNGLLTKEFNF